ncbi:MULTISPECIES: DUF4174 domain-containing protein [unclassified Tateyamaria]|jgi:hypothetical protein|uniref:DUF4174 domain-containing protein n=1 Tax=unclassified Tateyamaria TaxID=2645127 RepID=UPI000D5599A9|nr:DUF4174 domain-containing protein [Tateyamaria sp. Alg231-49]
MKHVLPVVIAGLLGGSLAAAEGEVTPAEALFVEGDVEDLSQFVWEKRPIIIFADSPADPNFGQQIEYLETRAQELLDRDVIVLTDTDPSGDSALRTKLRPRGFMLVLIGKDGGVKLRKPYPWDVRQLMRSIDSMPMRQREIRERRVESGG